jgi:glutamine synthetase
MVDSAELLAQKLAQYQERGGSRVKLGLTDLDGVLRGKYLSLDKFASVLAKGGGFCDCVFGWDVDDQLYDAGRYTGWHTEFPDADYRLLINSYTRLAKGAWAPTAATWGVENRTAAIRVIAGDAGRQHVECRVPGADANPYLVAAGVCAAALAGIEQALTPGDPVAGNAYDLQDSLPPERRFASNLRDAAERLGQSALARDMLGDEFVEHFVMTRLWECAEYERNLNSWQLERYFEII